MKMEKILVLAPHTDDAELGCGGAIARFLEEGKKVFVLAFSPAQADPSEFVNSMRILGVERFELKYYQFREFDQKRQDILDCLIEMRNSFKPDLVIMPSVYDTHQDHEIVCREGFRAFKRARILGYQSPWNQKIIDLSFFVSLEKRHLDKKMESLECYKSQRIKFYIKDDYVVGRARHLGYLVDVPYAEVFQQIRWVL